MGEYQPNRDSDDARHLPTLEKKLSIEVKTLNQVSCRKIFLKDLDNIFVTPLTIKKLLLNKQKKKF